MKDLWYVINNLRMFYCVGVCIYRGESGCINSCSCIFTWWRHQMETFSALLAICAGNSPVTGEFSAQRPVTRSFDVFFDLRRNKRLSKQWWGWWFETPPPPLWRHCNAKWLPNLRRKAWVFSHESIIGGIRKHIPEGDVSVNSRNPLGKILAMILMHSAVNCPSWMEEFVNTPSKVLVLYVSPRPPPAMTDWFA